MYAILIAICFLLTGLLNALPAIGVLGARQLQGLYGLEFSDPDLLTLMQHRAVMLGLIGLFMMTAAFRSELQPAAFVVGFVSMVSFVILAWLQGDPNRFIARVAIADVAGAGLLLVGLVLYWLQGRQALPA